MHLRSHKARGILSQIKEQGTVKIAKKVKVKTFNGMTSSKVNNVILNEKTIKKI